MCDTFDIDYVITHYRLHHHKLHPTFNELVHQLVNISDSCGSFDLLKGHLIGLWRKWAQYIRPPHRTMEEMDTTHCTLDQNIQKKQLRL